MRRKKNENSSLKFNSESMNSNIDVSRHLWGGQDNTFKYIRTKFIMYGPLWILCISS